MTRGSLLFGAFTSLVAFLLGLVVAGSRPIGEPRSALPHAVATGSPLTVSVVPASPAPAATAGVDFSVVAARVNGAVVNIDAAARGTERSQNPRRFQRGSGD